MRRAFAAIAAAVLVSGLVPGQAAALNAKLRIIGAEMFYNNAWEEVANLTDVGQTPANTAKAYARVQASANVTIKIDLYSGATGKVVATTQASVVSLATYTWTSGAFNTQAVPESMELRVYYKSGTSWILDDRTRGGYPEGHVWDRASVGRWFPNQYSDVIVDTNGTYRRATQYFWWWNNSFNGQTNGTAHLNRFKTWAKTSNAWLWTIEFRRYSKLQTFPIPNPEPIRDGWDFEKVCSIGGVTYGCGYNPWATNVPGLRIGDVEEQTLGGSEEAQFEVDNDDVASLAAISGADPHGTTARSYYVNLNFSKTGKFDGQPAYVMSGMQLETSPLPDAVYYFFLHTTGTTF